MVCIAEAMVKKLGADGVGVTYLFFCFEPSVNCEVVTKVSVFGIDW